MVYVEWTGGSEVLEIHIFLFEVTVPHESLGGHAGRLDTEQSFQQAGGQRQECNPRVYQWVGEGAEVARRDVARQTCVLGVGLAPHTACETTPA
jgi:hypothetical protein